jgi:FkbM family methyltransferase
MQVKSHLRASLERCSRRVWIRRRLTVGRNQVRIWVSPRAGLRYWRSVNQADPGLVDLARTHVRADDVVWDVGANVGLFGLTSAALGAKVFLFEPDLRCAEMARRSANLNDFKHSPSVLPIAVSSAIGIEALSVSVRNSSTSHLSAVAGSTQTGGSIGMVDVPTFSLDALLEWIPAPNFVKVDVEGAELLVLSGAKNLLAQHKPTVYFEFTDATLPLCRALLEEHDYGVSLIDGCNAIAVPRS